MSGPRYFAESDDDCTPFPEAEIEQDEVTDDSELHESTKRSNVLTQLDANSESDASTPGPDSGIRPVDGQMPVNVIQCFRYNLPVVMFRYNLPVAISLQVTCGKLPNLRKT